MKNENVPSYIEHINEEERLDKRMFLNTKKLKPILDSYILLHKEYLLQIKNEDDTKQNKSYISLMTDHIRDAKDFLFILEKGLW